MASMELSIAAECRSQKNEKRAKQSVRSMNEPLCCIHAKPASASSRMESRSSMGECLAECKTPMQLSHVRQISDAHADAASASKTQPLTTNLPQAPCLTRSRAASFTQRQGAAATQCPMPIAAMDCCLLKGSHESPSSSFCRTHCPQHHFV